MTTLTLYHNPKCQKSRQTLALLQEKGFNPTIIEYLKNPPSKAELCELLKMLKLEPRALMRTGEPEYRDLHLNDPALTEEALINAMVKNPKLIQRPILVHGKKAALGRPPEAVLTIL